MAAMALWHCNISVAYCTQVGRQASKVASKQPQDRSSSGESSKGKLNINIRINLAKVGDAATHDPAIAMVRVIIRVIVGAIVVVSCQSVCGVSALPVALAVHCPLVH